MRHTLHAHRAHDRLHFRLHARSHPQASVPPLHLRYRSQLLVAAAVIATLALFSGIWLQPAPPDPAQGPPSTSAVEADQDLAPAE